jgi:hypothetical protein
MSARASLPSHLLAVAAGLGPAAVTVGASMLISGLLAGLLGLVVGGLAGTLWFLRRRSPAVVIASALASLVGAVVAGGFLAGAIAELRGDYQAVSLAELDSIPEGRRVVVRDAQVVPLVWCTSAASGPEAGLDRSYCAAPIAKQGWQRDQPVSAFLRCEGDVESCKPSWSRPPAGQLWLRAPGDSDAIDVAGERHRLEISDPVAELSTSATATLDAVVTLIAAGFVVLLLFAGCLGLSLRIEGRGDAAEPAP